jgi:hypothetical protein
MLKTQLLPPGVKTLLSGTMQLLAGKALNRLPQGEMQWIFPAAYLQ